MFEGVVQGLLLDYLGRYIKDIQKDQLKIAVWNGNSRLLPFSLYFLYKEHHSSLLDDIHTICAPYCRGSPIGERGT